MQATTFKNPRRINSDYEALEKRGYRFGKKIGKGSYGNVVVAKFEDKRKGKKLDLACKCVAKDKAPRDFLDKFFPREIEVLRKISHPNIISIHSILQSGQTVFIFMRWAEKGDLLDYIKNAGALSESHACLWFFQMCSAIKYLHSLDYAHRDLKCENILISRRMNVKIADFGFTRKCIDESGDKIMSETFCGSTGNKKESWKNKIYISHRYAAYAPPEIVCGDSYDPMKSDVWSLGVILFIMLNSLMPFDDSNSRKLLRDQQEQRYQIRENIAEKLSDNCKSMIKDLLEPCPETRKDIFQIYQSSWLKKHVDNEIMKWRMDYLFCI